MATLPAPLQRLSSFLNSDSFAALAPGEETKQGLEMYTQAELKKADQADSTKAIESDLRSWYNSAKGARYQFEQQWYKNLDMAQGRQFTMWDDAKKQMVAIAPKDLEPRLPVNIIEPVMRTELAKTGSSHPTVTVSPASSDDEDIMAARSGNLVWQWFYDISDFQVTVFNQANYWRAHTGTGYIKTFVDFGCVDEAAMEASQRAATAEQDVADQAAANAMIPFKPTPVPSKPVYGKITAEPVSPFNIYVGDLLQPNFQKQPYVIHAYLLSQEQAKIRYKDYLPTDWAPATSSASQLMDATHLGIRGGNDAVKDQVLVQEFYVKPGYTTKLPDGGLAIMVADQLVALSKDGLPYKHGLYPFAPLTGIETGTFYRKSVVQSLTPLQDELNRIFAQLIKYKNMVVRPQMMYDEGSVDPSRITSAAGLWIPVRLGMKRPEAVQLPTLPQAVADLVDRLRAIVDDISGQHQVSRAQAPGANTAASALSLMQETDDNFLSPTFDSIELCLKLTGKMVLSNAQQFWDEPRYIKVVGEDSSVDARILKGADLNGGTDVRVETGSGLPMSKSARIAVVTDWMAKGFISPEMGMKALDLGALGKIYNLLRIDEDQAVRENLEIEGMDPEFLQAEQEKWDAAQREVESDGTEDPLTGQLAAGANPFLQMQDPSIGLQGDPTQPPLDPTQLAASPAPQPEPFLAMPVHEYDNHAVHAEVHARQMKSQEFEAWPPERQQALLQHYLAHVQAAAMQGIQITGGGAQQGMPQLGQPTGAPASGYAATDQTPQLQSAA